ncbi:RHS repeat domain-containing protein [Streptomyces sp. NPDC088729]|uniref:RHS repeat domain-containing protein n=1 Tax=Streptomyces sp. NPDC088729 TaxID=3365876 RepID=UPI00380D7B9E
MPLSHSFPGRRVVSSCVAVALGASLPWIAGMSTAFAASGSGPGSGSLASALSSLGGTVDEQKGQVRFGVKMGGVPGPADSGLEVNAQFSQQLASEGVDRFGLGAGWTLGLPFVDVERGVLVLPSGEHVLDDSDPSGMKNYKLDDLKVSRTVGSAPVQHAYALESRKDGSKQFLDTQGNLVGVQSSLGHLTKLSWNVVNGKHRLASVTGPWGSKLTVKYVGSTVTFISPKRWGQTEAPKSELKLSQNRVESVKDQANQTTRVEYTPNPVGTSGLTLPSAVVSPTGARSEFTYKQYEARSGGVVAVSEMGVKAVGEDGKEKVLLEPVTLSLDPDGANGGRNWTGCPQYCADGTDRLANSGDGSFSYRVKMSQKNGQEVERTYNALHLQTDEVVRVRQGSQPKDISRTEYTYPGEKADGAPPKVMDAPRDYQMPSEVKVTTIDPADSSRRKEARVSARVDGMGRTVWQKQGGVETSEEYGPNSLPVRTEKKDTATGARQVTESTLTADGKAVAKTVTKAAGPGGGELKTVSTAEFDYHGGELAGEVKATRTTGDAGAKGGDPGVAVTRTESSVERDAEGVGRRTDRVTGDDGVETTTVSDLASGAKLSEKTADLGGTSTEYDVADRPVKSTAADGTVTTVNYDVKNGGSSTTTRRESDGLASRTVTDEMGREVRKESNYKPSGRDGQGEILPQGQFRQVGGAEFNSAGQQVKTTDSAARETRIEYNAFGRPSKVTAPDGTVTVGTHDDVAGTKTSQTTLPGADRPMTRAVETVDDQGNPVKTETAFGDGTPGTVTETTFDAFGKPQQSQSDNGPFTVNHSYTAAGLPESDTLTPKQNGVGSNVKSEYVQDSFGNKTQKNLTSQGQSAEGWKTSFDVSGRPSQVTAPGNGGTMSPSYNKVNGLVESVTQADGAVEHQRRDLAGRTVEEWTSPKDAPGTKKEHVRMSYDPVTGKTAAQWFADDEAGSKITYTRFPDGNVKERVDPGGKKTSFTYTDENKPATVTDHTGAVTTYTYDQKTGRTTQVVQVRDGKELAKVTYTHNAAGRLEKIDRGNGATSTYTHNDGGRPTGEKHTRPGGEVIAEHAYTYTREAQPKLATDIATVGGKRTTTAYAYDDKARLTQSHVTEGAQPRSGTLISKSDYVYDLASNLTQKKTTTRGGDGAEKTSTTDYTADTASRTTKITTDGQEKPQTYDSAGRLTQSADGTRNTYNNSGQLTETVAPDGTTVTNTYRPTGERATQTTTKDGRTHTLTYNPGTETDQDGTTATHLNAAGTESRTLTTKDGQTNTAYYLTNRHGDKTHTLDANGNITSHTQYTDYGIPRSGNADPTQPAPRTGAITENPYGYAGQYTIPTGPQPLGARWYDPTKGALTTADTPTAAMFNPYTYATGDPVNKFDPTGESWEDVWGWFTDEFPGWEGMPYLELGLAVGGVAITVFSGGSGIAIGVAVIAGALTLPSAADQISINAGHGAFLPQDVRTAFDIAGMVGSVADAGIGLVHTPKLIRMTRAGFAQGRGLKSAPDLAEYLTNRSPHFTAIESGETGESVSYWARRNPALDQKNVDLVETKLNFDLKRPAQSPHEGAPTVLKVDAEDQIDFARVTVDPDDPQVQKLKKTMDDLVTMTAAQNAATLQVLDLPEDMQEAAIGVVQSINIRIAELQQQGTQIIRGMPQNSAKTYMPTLYMQDGVNGPTVLFTDAYIYPRGTWKK